MELLLLLWFYDNRWFFNFKISILCFKNAWIIPLFLNALLMTICIYYLNIDSSFHCEKSLRAWLYIRTIFSLLLVINILVFMTKISDLYDKEIEFLQKSKKIYPILNGEMNKLDIWVRRQSIRSVYGMSLLILGLISLFWSFLIISFYHSNNMFKNCDIIIQQLLNIHSMFVFIGNIPIFIIFLSLITIKTISLISSYVCPDCLIFVSKPFHNEIIQAEDS